MAEVHRAPPHLAPNASVLVKARFIQGKEPCESTGHLRIAGRSLSA